MKKLFAVVGFVSCFAASSARAADVTSGTTGAAPSMVVAPDLMKNAQYVYVAKELGMLDQQTSDLWRRCCSFLKRYKSELVLGSGVLVGAAVYGACGLRLKSLKREQDALQKAEPKPTGRDYMGYVEKHDAWRKKDRSLAASIGDLENDKGFIFRAVAGTLVTWACVGLISKYCGKFFVDDVAWHKGKLVNFLRQWDTHKQNTPGELHPLFDRLVVNSAAITGDDQLMHDVYKNIAELCIKGMVTKPA